MQTKVLKSILSFAEKGPIASVVVAGERIDFETTIRDKKTKERETISGSSDYDVNEKDGILQVIDDKGHYFLGIESINAIQMIL